MILDSNNGLIAKAKQAKSETDKAQVNEANGLNSLANQLNTYIEENILKPSDLAIGTYVKYKVTYTDMYSGYEFKEKDGWRILKPGYKNEDGTYSGVKLISTGIPAKLNYDSETVKNYKYDGTIGKWAGTVTQLAAYRSNFYGPREDYYPNIIAASGLYYNFGKIPFTQGISPIINTGGFTKINNKTSGSLTEDEFLAKGEKIEGTEVHNLTIYELNEARNKKAGADSFALNQPDETTFGNRVTTENDAAIGLFYLKGLNKFNFNISEMRYWLASPSNVYGNIIFYMNENGVFYGNYYNANMTFGVRPVVSLKDNVTLEVVEN